MLRKIMLAGVAASALFAQSDIADAAKIKSTPSLVSLDKPVSQFYGSINPFYGSINPFYGSINPFYGSINPFYGSISPFWGNINPFWGNINPFYGSINPFYGSINPFYGSINPFYGSINPFYGSITPFYGNIQTFWGKVDPFWGSISPFYGSINPFWGTVQPFWQSAGPQWGDINMQWTVLQMANVSDYSSVQSQLQNFINSSQTFWGSAVQKYTGKSFMDGFGSAMLAKYGIDPNNAASLANVSSATRSAFFLNWYDGLMSYTGVDHVDWWMAATHWTPQLTQIQNAGSNSTVGILDATVDSTGTDGGRIHFAGGYDTYVNDHGAAVASLIAAPHDGQGVMGVAPNSKIELYNPFDQTGTASWEDVQAGILKLYSQHATVINASLGVPGVVLSPEWSNIMTAAAVNDKKGGFVLVKAAGNDGLAQTSNVAWAGTSAPSNLILVGSLGPDGNISSFSNTPGESCILISGVCNEQNKLKYDFIVAPGENLLVSDNRGGVVRVSGTSFAAPLVTGAVALLQDRWPWLQQHSAETVQIILQSAHDLGAPGVDPVYGWGALDIEASQSPLNFNNLVVYQPATYKSSVDFKTAGGAAWNAASLKSSVINPGQLDLWQKQSAYIVAIENIGTTYRDFTIPLSSMLVGKSQKVNGSANPFQSYLYQRLITWAAGGSSFNSFNSRTVPMGDGDWSMSLNMQKPTSEDGTGSTFESEVIVFNRAQGLGLRLGQGSGSHALTSDDAFTLASDFAPSTGGVNPVLGFASGGAYARVDAQFGPLRFNAGFTQKSDNHSRLDPTFGVLQTLPLPTSKAAASTVGADYVVTANVTLNSSFTRLDEGNGLLGAEGSGLFAISGAHTDGVTLGATFKLQHGFAFAASATSAQTNGAAFANSALSLTKGGLHSTAYEIVASKTGLFSELDKMRISFAQPLHVDNGALSYQSLEVVDRDTGALGPVTQSWNVSGKREFRAEALYAVPVFDGGADLGAFGLVDINPPATSKALSLSGGMQIRFTL
jgi:hypothetical protein